MSYQVLARKWRPADFESLVGQEHVVRALVNALDQERLHHAYLFTGTRGVGKTTIARILAKCLNCEAGVSSRPCGECGACREIDAGRFIDLLEVDAASRTKVEDTRELLENVQYAPSSGRFKIYLIDEVHMLSTHSFNALLKTLEEPPPHVKFLLATTDPQKLPVTVLSRCLQFNLKHMPGAAIAAHLEHILGAEGVQAEAAAVQRIARAADGSMRDALSLLDQAIAHGEGQVSVHDVSQMLGDVPRERVYALLERLAEDDAGGLLEQVAGLAETVTDFAGVLDDLALGLQQLAVLALVPEAGHADAEEQARLAGLAARLTPEDVQLFYQIALIGKRDLPLAPDPRSGFEMVLLRMLAFRPAGAVAPQAQARAAAPAAPAPAAPRESSAPAAAGQPVAPRAPAAAEVGGGADEWHALLPALALRGLPEQLAANCELLERSDGLVRLRLAAGHANLMSETARERIEQALGQTLGTPVRLDIQLGETGAETPAQRAERQQDERRRQAREALDSDPLVQGLQERFDASLDAGSVRPADSPGEG